MTENRKTPKLRFKGFTDAWEQRKFSDVVEISSGMDYKHLGIGDIPVYGTGGYMLSVDVALSENNDAIGIGRKGTIDKPYILRAPFWTVDTLFYCIPKYNHNLDFTNCLFQNVDWKNKDESTGVPSLSKVIINNIETSIPSYEEQKKIGEYFKSFDNLITLHQRKLDWLKNIKRSMLDKMFPKDGEVVPEIRFKGFTDAWEQRKLEEIVDSYSGGTPTAGKSEYYGGTIPFIRSAEVNSDTTELFLTEEGLKTSSAKMVNKGDILYALYGATSGEVGLARLDGAINQAILDIKPHEDYDTPFIMNWLRKSKESIIGTYLQGGQGNLSGTIVTSLMVDCPDYDEQKRIGEFFTNIDNLITLHQRKLDKLKNIKKSMLDNMFV